MPAMCIFDLKWPLPARLIFQRCVPLMLDKVLDMDELILKELDQIGFSRFVHLDEKKRDGKRRWTWNYPVESHKDWFTVLLVEEEGAILIERLTNPLGRNFQANQPKDLISYVQTVIIKR